MNIFWCAIFLSRHACLLFSCKITDLEQQSEFIISESLLTTFEARIIFEVAGEVGKIGLSLKPNHYNQVKVKLVQIPNTFVYTNDITDYAYLRLIRCKFFPFKIEKFFIFFSQNLFIFCTILFTKTDRKLQV